MASYVVLTPPDAGRLDERAVLIRDGFAFWALILPFFWLLWFRLWYQASIVFLAGIAVALSSRAWPDWSSVFVLTSILISVYVALEGNAMRVARKERQGWMGRSVVVAPNRSTAEEICFADQDGVEGPKDEAAPISQPGAKMQQHTGPRPRRAVSGPALGLLDVGNGS